MVKVGHQEDHGIRKPKDPLPTPGPQTPPELRSMAWRFLLDHPRTWPPCPCLCGPWQSEISSAPEQSHGIPWPHSCPASCYTRWMALKSDDHSFSTATHSPAKVFSVAFRSKWTSGNIVLDIPNTRISRLKKMEQNI